MELPTGSGKERTQLARMLVLFPQHGLPTLVRVSAVHRTKLFSRKNCQPHGILEQVSEHLCFHGSLLVVDAGQCEATGRESPEAHLGMRDSGC